MSTDFVVYGAVPWQEPWLVEHNLAHALAERHRVLYVEPPVTPLTPFRHPAAGRVSTELRHLARRRPRRVAGLHAFRPLALPPLERRAARAASAPLVRAQVARAARSVGIERPVVISALRSTLELRGALDETFHVYVVMDWVGAGAGLLGRDAQRLTAEVEAMCAAADLVCASSRQLCATLASRGFEAELLQHGFHADLARLYDSAPMPAEYAGLPRPLIGYSGTIDARLDFAALAALADRFADGSLVFVGPVSPRLDPAALGPLRERVNVHFLGLRARDQVPRYLRHLDCCLMPYLEDEWARHGLPLKLWDYLYAGPPIVGSGYASLREFPPPLVRFSSGGAALADNVGSALAAGDEGRDERRAFALANSWDARAELLEGLVAERLGNRAEGAFAHAGERAGGGSAAWAEASSI